MSPIDLQTESARLRARGWEFDVSPRGRYTAWQGSAMLPTGEDGPASLYASGTTRERVERALLDGALALTGNPWATE